MTVPPVGIDLAWANHIRTSVFEHWNTAYCIFFVVMFTSSTLIGFSTWYSHNWALKRTTTFCKWVGSISCALFALMMTFVPVNYTYTGATAIGLVLNFGPACYLIYLKARWDDLDLKLLYKTISKYMLEGKFSLAILELND